MLSQEEIIVVKYGGASRPASGRKKVIKKTIEFQKATQSKQALKTAATDR
jgi:hypothetical protein